MDQTWAQRLLRGAIAGVAGGFASAVVLWVVVEPALGTAIGLESAGEHGHEGEEIVTRLQQQIGGTVTVIVVAALLGLAFAVVYSRSRHHLPGSTDLGKSLALAAFAFTVLALLPALLVPANPPGVGDPSTVNARTLTYLAGIALGLIAVLALFAINRALVERGLSDEALWIATAGAATVIFGAILAFGPTVPEDIPHTVPASIVWQFRIGSLGQLASMWILIGIVHGALQHRSVARAQSRSRSWARA